MKKILGVVLAVLLCAGIVYAADMPAAPEAAAPATVQQASQEKTVEGVIKEVTLGQIIITASADVGTIKKDSEVTVNLTPTTNFYNVETVADFFAGDQVSITYVENGTMIDALSITKVIKEVEEDDL
jgi:hypothetical protein